MHASTATHKFLKGRKHLTPNEETLQWLGIKQSRVEKIRTGLYKREIQAEGYPIDNKNHSTGIMRRFVNTVKNFFNRRA